MGIRGPLAPNEHYHLYNRGTDRRVIFNTQADYERFLGLLYLSNNTQPTNLSNYRGSTLTQWLEVERQEPLVDIYAYCLMPNHFHLLVRQREEGGVSRFMQKLVTGYTMYFNKINDRTGSLMQGKFKSSHADSDQYFKHLFSYIHLNPVKLIDPKWKEAGIADKAQARTYLETYRYSSYLDYCGKERPESAIINKSAALEFAEVPTDFKNSVEEWLSNGAEHLNEV